MPEDCLWSALEMLVSNGVCFLCIWCRCMYCNLLSLSTEKVLCETLAIYTCTFTYFIFTGTLTLRFVSSSFSFSLLARCGRAVHFAHSLGPRGGRSDPPGPLHLTECFDAAANYDAGELHCRVYVECAVPPQRPLQRKWCHFSCIVVLFLYYYVGEPQVPTHFTKFTNSGLNYPLLITFFSTPPQYI